MADDLRAPPDRHQPVPPHPPVRPLEVLETIRGTGVKTVNWSDRRQVYELLAA